MIYCEATLLLSILHGLSEGTAPERFAVVTCAGYRDYPHTTAPYDQQVMSVNPGVPSYDRLPVPSAIPYYYLIFGSSTSLYIACIHNMTPRLKIPEGSLYTHAQSLVTSFGPTGDLASLERAYAVAIRRTNIISPPLNLNEELSLAL